MIRHKATLAKLMLFEFKVAILDFGR